MTKKPGKLGWPGFFVMTRIPASVESPVIVHAQSCDGVSADEASLWFDVDGSEMRKWSVVVLLLASASTAPRDLCYTGGMTIKNLHHISVVVDDLAAAIAFFTALGMTIEGEAAIEGPWVDRVNAIEGVQVDIAMMRTPDGHGRLELTKFRSPQLVEVEPAIAPPNALGLRSVMFAVESLDDTVARLRKMGAKLIGEVAQYEDIYRLCYMRGPAGIIVALAEELS